MPQPIGAMPSPGLARPELLTGKPAAASGPVQDFQNVLLKAIEDVNQVDRQAQAGVAQGLTDPQGLQTDTYVRMMQADLAFRTMLQIRNKLLEAFNEVKQMQV